VGTNESLIQMEYRAVVFERGSDETRNSLADLTDAERQRLGLLYQKPRLTKADTLELVRRQV